MSLAMLLHGSDMKLLIGNGRLSKVAKIEATRVKDELRED